ncbi:MAG TPA: hypothetical protein VNA19_01390 [Pyrinomonadaceae bacterium]|jgi:hypothetical protein|nr:hypothetical protein [Pyrinomonadaceae bacterium]
MMQTIRHLNHIVRWNLRGKPVPPPHVVKQLAIKQYQKRFNLGVFVETGTYLGEMVEAMRARFRKVYSVELSAELCARAREMFARYPHVEILQGDSSDMLPLILGRIVEPALFWLDGHFSGGFTAQGPLDYPILKELEHIRRHEIKNHVILIDDARLFEGTPNAPAKEQVLARLREINPAYIIEEKDDIIRAFAGQQ